MERDFRMTIHDGAVHLVDWVPWLAGRGPSRRVLEDHARVHGTTFLDLEVVRERDVAQELVAVFLAGAVDGVARETLVGWAQLVGYRRLWLPGELVVLEPACGGAVTTACDACEAPFTEDDGHFWQTARMNGRFPVHCPLCGGSLPQWRAVPSDIDQAPGGECARAGTGTPW